jgi:hypothetical protein
MLISRRASPLARPSPRRGGAPALCRRSEAILQSWPFLTMVHFSCGGLSHPPATTLSGVTRAPSCTAWLRSTQCKLTVGRTSEGNIDSDMAGRRVRSASVLGYELWDAESGNAVGGYESERAALLAAAQIIARRRPEHVASLVLLRVGPRGGLKRIARGARLALRANAAASNPPSVAASA